MSMKPGTTIRPLASRRRAAGASPIAPTLTIRPLRTATSAASRLPPVPSTTVPPEMRMSNGSSAASAIGELLKNAAGSARPAATPAERARNFLRDTVSHPSHLDAEGTEDRAASQLSFIFKTEEFIVMCQAGRRQLVNVRPSLFDWNWNDNSTRFSDELFFVWEFVP